MFPPQIADMAPKRFPMILIIRRSPSLAGYTLCGGAHRDAPLLIADVQFHV